MNTPLAWLNLLHNKVRTLVVVAGVAFAIILIFMQLGFRGSIETTATLIYDALDFDLVVRSKEYLHISDAATIRQTRMVQAQSITGVKRVRPFYIGLNEWRHPRLGHGRGILAIGIDPHDPVLTLPEIRRKAHLLTHPDAVLIDRQSRADFGPANGRRFGDDDIGVITEVGFQRVEVTGHFALGTGLAADGAILLSEQGFKRLFPQRAAGEVSLALITLQSGADADQVADRLRKALPADVEVLTRAEVIDFELKRWLDETSIGVIFQVGVVVAMIVGMAIVYQVLSSDIADHFAEYATLKAMGYRSGFLARVVLQQAISLAVLGFIPALAASWLLYRLTSQVANMPVEMNGRRIVIVFFLSIAMCCLSGLIALRKVNRAEPADLF